MPPRALRAHSSCAAKTVALRTPALALAVSLSALFVARVAAANPGITGYSGKPYNGVTDTCKTNCHVGGGTAPTLDITVPTAMKAGDTAAVTLVINGTRTRTSMNAALSDGVTATKGQNTEIPFPVQTPGEVAAVAPPPNGANGTYKFSFVAPNKNGPITLWIAAMSANGTGSGGDGVATATRTITVSGATQPGTDAGTTTDGGVEGSTDAGSKPDGRAPAGSSDGGPEGAEDGATSSGSSRRSSTPSDDDQGGCRAARSGTPADAGALALIIGTLALVASRRSRR